MSEQTFEIEFRQGGIPVAVRRYSLSEAGRPLGTELAEHLGLTRLAEQNEVHVLAASDAEVDASRIIAPGELNGMTLGDTVRRATGRDVQAGARVAADLTESHDGAEVLR